MVLYSSGLEVTFNVLLLPSTSSQITYIFLLKMVTSGFSDEPQVFDRFVGVENPLPRLNTAKTSGFLSAALNVPDQTSTTCPAASQAKSGALDTPGVFDTFTALSNPPPPIASAQRI